MEVGFALPQYDYSVPGQSSLQWATVRQWATAAERAGFTSLWVSDHLFLTLDRYNGPADVRYGCIDPITTMGALTQCTGASTTVGCLVFCAQLRPPRLLAKHLETLDILAPGRIVAGIGAGWNEAEFDEAGVVFERPGARLRQLVETSEEVRAFLGAGRVPLWFGGKGDRLVELAARHADGWNTVWAWTPEDYSRKLEVIRRTCDEIGRDPGTLTLSLGLTTLVGEDDADVRRRWKALQDTVPHRMLDGTDFDDWRTGRLVGSVDQVREQVATWRSFGVAVLVVNLGALPFSVTTPDDLTLLASALT